MDHDGKVKSYKDLMVWRKGIELAKAVYQLTRAFPSEEKFGLIAQTRRAAVSVPSNTGEQTSATIEQVHGLQKMIHSLQSKLATSHSPPATVKGQTK